MNQHAVQLGRLGGRAGGPRGGRARMALLTAAERKELGRQAAEARWGTERLKFLVSNVGAAVDRTNVPDRRLTGYVVRGAEASRKDASLARMMPVFVWRVRDRVDLDDVVRTAKRNGTAHLVGYFLELAGRLGGEPERFRPALTALRKALPEKPTYLFDDTEHLPFARKVADETSPPEARRWRLLANMPFDSYETYFRKVSDL